MKRIAAFDKTRPHTSSLLNIDIFYLSRQIKSKGYYNTAHFLGRLEMIRSESYPVELYRQEFCSSDFLSQVLKCTK